MNLHPDGLAQVQAEDAHDGLGINNVPPGCKVYVKIILVDDIDKILHIIYGLQ